MSQFRYTNIQKQLKLTRPPQSAKIIQNKPRMQTVTKFIKPVDEKNPIFETTNQSFFGLKKFTKIIQELKNELSVKQQEECKPKTCQEMFVDKMSLKSRKSDATEEKFLEADSDFRIRKFLEGFASCNQDMIIKLVKENLDYFLHIFRFCNCGLCSCGSCKCDFAKKGDSFKFRPPEDKIQVGHDDHVQIRLRFKGLR